MALLDTMYPPFEIIGSTVDWKSVQAEVNQNLTQFTTTVYAGANYTDPMPLHFVHHKSSRPDAIPLLSIHGWPGSFLEVTKIINDLTSPPNASVPAFHVMAPSLPGYGFSPAPKEPGLGPREAGQAFNYLMTKQHNYPKYVVQGGDFGGFALRYMEANSQRQWFPAYQISFQHLQMRRIWHDLLREERFQRKTTTYTD